MMAVLTRITWVLFTSMVVLIFSYTEATHDDDLLMVDKVDEAFETLIEHSGHIGGVFGVLRHGKLVHTGGYGSTLAGHVVYPGTLLPASSVSKLITATAILQLIERGQLGLTSRVFAKGGILHGYKPKKHGWLDDRVRDITVEHLLRHTAGWDETKGPVYDPMLNGFYLSQGYNAPSIAEELNVDAILNQQFIIQYMLRQPLHFTPGTRVRYSNFGYCVLGQIIEKVTDLPYEEYVKENILVPLGMWHTRIGPHPFIPNFENNPEIKSNHGYPSLQFEDGTIELSDKDTQRLHEIINPQLLDSTSGWYSTVYDVSRLISSLLGRTQLQVLQPETAHVLFERPPPPDALNTHTWRAIGFQVSNSGKFWLEGHDHASDVIVYHRGESAMLRNGPLGNKNYLERAVWDEDITVIGLFVSGTQHPLKHLLEKTLRTVPYWPVKENMMLDDLSDYQVVAIGHDRLVINDLNEHHLEAYSNALRMARYKPTWLHGYVHSKSTKFIVISEKVSSPEELEYQLEVSASKKKIVSHISNLIEDGYQPGFIQSYTSYAHDHRMCHIALMERKSSKAARPIRWDIADELDSYFFDLDKALGEGYSALAQSVATYKHKIFVSYLFAKDAPQESSERLPSQSYHDLTLERLEETVKSNALMKYNLEYLDTYLDGGKPRFSAIFRKTQFKKWILQTDVQHERLVEQAMKWEAMGYIPKILVGYEKDEDIRFLGLWIRP